MVLVLRGEDLGGAIASIRESGGTITQKPGAIGEADPVQDACSLELNGNEMGVYVGP